MSALDFLMSRGMQRVLGRLILNPERSYSLSDLIRAAGGGRGGTQQTVETLRSAGVVTDTRVGNQRLFRVNTAHPLYPELRSMSMKTFGLADRLRGALQSVADRIETAFVFGSVASGTDRATSDIDLLVVGHVDLFEISPLLTEAEKELGRPIHLSLVGPEQWASWRQNGMGYAIANGPKIMVIGNEPGRTDRKPDPRRSPEGGVAG
jgi:predicted nucleotidyltransferase